MTAFANHEFWLNEAQGDGATRRAHLEAASRQMGHTAPDLEGPPCPDALLPIWHLFLGLSAQRTLHAAGPNPLTWPELDAYCRLSGDDWSSFELTAILALDRVFLAAQAAAMQRRMASKASK